MFKDCSSCVWWKEPVTPRKRAYGECHYNAPKVVNATSYKPWPKVRADDWCGQWEGPGNPE